VRDALLGAVLDRHLAGRQQPHDVDQEAARHDDRALLAHLRLERDAQRDLHVGGGKREPSVLRLKENARQDLDARTGGDAAAGDAELRCELLPGTGDPHAGGGNGIDCRHLREPLVVVVDSVKTGEDVGQALR
jgi:hypothetical protein